MTKDFVNSHTAPLQFYMKSGKLLEAYGVEEEYSFKTHYFIECSNNKKEGCLILILLIPIRVCDQIYLKRTDNTLIIKTDCLISRQELDNGFLVSDVLYVYDLHDYFKGKFKILDGFCETIIWKTNLENESKCWVRLSYDKGIEDSIEIYAQCDNNEESFELKRGFPLILELKRCTKLICRRKDDHGGPVQGKFQLTLENEVLYKAKNSREDM